MVHNPKFLKGDLIFDLVFTESHTKDMRELVDHHLVDAIRALGWEEGVVPMWHVREAPRKGGQTVAGHAVAPGVIHNPPASQTAPEIPPPTPITGIKHIIAVASGKGGVGKSTIATNLAVGLAKAGYKVGLLDADVYGPSLPRMMGVTEQPVANERGIVPVVAHGVACVSLGLLVPEDQAIIWRGPIVTGLIKQFLEQVDWGTLDYLVLDLPPGTGDVQLTLVQTAPLAGAVIVTTPQPVALGDAVRGLAMFQKVDVPILGLVETMSWYELPDGTRDYVFGEGGGQRIADGAGVPLLGQFPLLTAVRRAGDEGVPMATREDGLGQNYRAMAKAVAALLPL
ncbi:MAG: Mrp/NBP35 family ATP-binding protein [Deltaproteobacteria bacterium]|nr:Mrp/NBP35 family ATP-binding protein [Deltaproteobacteria bacterium]